MTWAALADRIQEHLSLRSAPVAVAFRDAPPPGVARVDKTTPSGCTFWKMAAEGRVFFTLPEDHHGCAVGAHTHAVPMSPALASDLQGLITTMVGLEYLREEEVPGIPTLKRPFGSAIYAPLAATPCDPDVVLLRGNARQMMMATEAARALGIESTAPLRERPTCAMIPDAVQGAGSTPSFACIGNRVYTDLADDELYVAVPGAKLEAFVERLGVIARANRELERFHKARLPLLADR